MVYFFWFILGTIVGSFLNVCIYRLPQSKSIINPPSHCPRCQKRLSFFDLLPILSFFLMRGKCRYCGAPISWRYPLVEFLTGLGFLGLA
ncbi:MAG: prepilin peptidase, partial [Candidatus Margulisiibacteriota bacterium]